jgi:cell fate regulator YaaT (PSP1 superfamily)
MTRPTVSAPAVSRSAAPAVQRAISASWARVETAEVRAGAYGDDSDDDVAPPPPLQRLTPAEPVPPEAPVGFANLIGVKFHSRGVIHEFDCGSEVYQRDDIVLVEGERGGRLARVAVGTQRGYVLGPMRRVLRRGRPDELVNLSDAAQLEAEAYRFCKERLRERKLPMKLVQTEVLWGQKAIFYFASEERIDFRELVRDLAQRFHTRIEMRQIGARDGAKAVGGIGSCGRELCCTTFLPSFQPVSIRMAKDQGMVLNPSKLAGQCGRLKCCLVYEHQTYKELGKTLPKVGKRVVTPAGIGRVLDLDILGQRVRVYLEEGGAQSFAGSEVKLLSAVQGSGQTPADGDRDGDGDSGADGDSDGEVGLGTAATLTELPAATTLAMDSAEPPVG